ncbi:hypothetical protein HaLaN_25160 [Haematococcus lacustris]|uniref:Uncharacterized protein n=1 Tax=Haematococcus lacustris TaxID=44745 RepID=A0A6A0A3B2_HAELA|nr:hypothetical protein HaLaN_25160 [Haematococcus lacustris]
MVDLHFPFPVTVAWMGLVVTLCCSTACVRLSLPPAQRQPMSLRQYLSTVYLVA